MGAQSMYTNRQAIYTKCRDGLLFFRNSAQKVKDYTQGFTEELVNRFG